MCASAKRVRDVMNNKCSAGACARVSDRFNSTIAIRIEALRAGSFVGGTRLNEWARKLHTNKSQIASAHTLSDAALTGHSAHKYAYFVTVERIAGSVPCAVF